jgi:hypothetical protein
MIGLVRHLIGGLLNTKRAVFASCGIRRESSVMVDRVLPAVAEAGLL